MSQSTNETIVYVGAYTRAEPHVQGKAQGIYVYRLDQANGALQLLSTATGMVNPSFLTVDSGGRYLYAVQEVGEYEGQPGGAVSAFSIDPQTHALTLLNHQFTHGGAPCHVTIDSTGRWLLVANYGGGNVCVLPIGDDGTLGAATATVYHEGQATHHDGPHPHSTWMTSDNRYILVPDCGLDRIFIYTLDTEHGKLLAHDTPFVMLAPGAGPRHLAFHPNGKYVYSINERNSTLTAFAYEGGGNVLRELHTLTTLPDDFHGSNSCADIHIDAAGRYVYGSNRGHDSIAIFAVDEASGKVSPRGHVSTGGRNPRNFALDSAHNLLLAANQDTSNIVAFSVDSATGALTPTGEVTDAATPVCVLCVSRET